MRTFRLVEGVAGVTLLLVAAACSSNGTSGLTGGFGGSSGTGNSTGSGKGGAGGTTASSNGGATASTGSMSTSTSSGTGGTTTSTASGTTTSTTSGTTTSTTSGTTTSTTSGTTSTSTGAGGSSTVDAGPPTFGSECDAGTLTVLTGTVYAPNGIDPIPRVRVYAAIQINPFPAGYCDECAAPVDPAYVATFSAADGTYSLNLDAVPAGATIIFAIQIGRFRKWTVLPVTPCQALTVPMAAETLPGANGTNANIPKIAVSTGNTDHLDVILNDLGITEFDCYEGRVGSSAGTTSATCPLSITNPATHASYNIADVVSNTNAANGPAITSYNMAFVSCAPNAYATFITPKGQTYTAPGTTTTYPGQGYTQSTLTTDTQSWVGSGGRLFVTDTSYDWVAQAFPSSPITWEGAAGSPPPIDGANVGCSPPNNTNGPPTPYTVNIDDPTLAAWLKLPVTGLNFATSPSVQVDGFYEPWSAMASFVASSTATKIADGTMPLDLKSTLANACYSGTANQSMVDVPLTAQFDVPTCGRVLFSSYHTYGKAATGNVSVANASIMEYLIFAAAYCSG
jgi:hypothetical protein